jgi:hypothetical protein
MMTTDMEFDSWNTNTSRVPQVQQHSVREECETDGDWMIETMTTTEPPSLCHTKLNACSLSIHSQTRRCALGYSVLTQANARMACAAACSELLKAELLLLEEADMMMTEQPEDDPIMTTTGTAQNQPSSAPVSQKQLSSSLSISATLTPRHRPKRIRADPA